MNRPAGRAVGRRGFGTSALVAWLGAFALLCMAVAAISLWRLRTLEKQTVDRFAVVEAVRKILKIATVETQIAEVVTYRDVKDVLLFFSSEKNAIVRVQGRVLAGFDLTSEKVDIRVDEPSRVVRVRLPRARVLSIDPRIEILDERSGWQNAVTREDRNYWMKWARGDVRRAALLSGITAQAEKNVRELLTTFTEAYGYRLEVTFEGKPKEEPEPAGPGPHG